MSFDEGTNESAEFYVFERASERVGAGAPDKVGDHDAVMSVIAEFHSYASLPDVPVLKGKGACRVIGGNDHKRMSVLFRPQQDIAYGAVKIEYLLHGEVYAVSVQPVVDAGALDHGYETLFAAGFGEKIEAACSHDAEQVAPFGGNREIVI